MKSLILLGLMLLIASPALGQCPGGVCPPQRVTFRSMLPVRQVQAVRYSQPVMANTGSTAHSRGQWSYPGSITDHLAQTHGVASTQGMTLEQMETLHSQLHEGNQPTMVRSRTVVRSSMVPQMKLVTRTKRFIRFSPF